MLHQWDYYLFPSTLIHVKHFKMLTPDVDVFTSSEYLVVRCHFVHNGSFGYCASNLTGTRCHIYVIIY